MFLKYSIMFFERGALYMLLLTKSILSLMIGFIASVIVGLILIQSLKRINFGQRISEYVGESHRKKEGTPTMGGIIFIIPTVIGITYLVMSGKLQMTYNRCWLYEPALYSPFALTLINLLHNRYSYEAFLEQRTFLLIALVSYHIILCQL